MNEFGLALLWLMGQISVLCLVAMPVYLLARRGHPRSGALATLATLLLITAVSVAALSPWPRWSISDSSRRDGVANAAVSTENAVRPVGNETRSPAAGESSTATVDATTVALLVEAAGDLWQRLGQRSAMMTEAADTVEEAKSLAWTGWLAWLFVAGLAVSVTRLLLGLLAVARHRRNSEVITDAEILAEVDVLCTEFGYRWPIEVRRSETIASAATVGWKRPLILLPPEHVDWTASERRGVLAHEIAHICSNDFPCWVCAQAGLLLHFYHPLVHWLARRLRLEQELAADAAAAKFSGGAEPYLQTLAALALRQADRPVAWPARTFLPVKGTLIRRVEMLRESRVARAVPSLWRHGAVITLLLAASLVLCGIKPPESRQALAGSAPPANASPEDIVVSEEVATVGAQVVAAASGQPEDTLFAQADKTQARRERSEAAEPFDLSYVPTNTNLLLGIRPSQLAGEETVAPLIDGVEKMLGTLGSPGTKIADLKQVIVVGMPDERSSLPVGNRPVALFTPENGAGERVHAWAKSFVADELIIRGRRPIQLQQREKPRGPLMATFVPPGGKATNPDAIAIGDDEMVRAVVVAATSNATSPGWLDEFKAVSHHQMAFAANMKALGAVIDSGNGAGSGPAAAFAPLWQQTELIVGGSSIGKAGRGEVIAHCRDEAAAKQVAETAQALIPLARNMLDVVERQSAEAAARNPDAAPAQVRKAMGDSLTVVRNFLNSAHISAKSRIASLTAEADTGSLPVMVGLLLPAVQGSREAARRTRSINNLKQIGLALHNYHAVHNHFPPPVLVGPDGKTTHSWRVAILPYVDASDLYNEYKLDEPWDSENNLKVLKQMPTVFRHPNEPEGSTVACYFALTGSNTAFGEGGEGTPIRDITDGSSNTLMVVEARRDIPWTKPDDIPYDAGQPVPKFGGFQPGIWLTELADGSVRTIAEAIDEKTVRALITRNGGERLPQN